MRICRNRTWKNGKKNRQIRRADYRAGYSDTRGCAADAGGAENRTSAGRKEHRHYRRFAGIAAAVAVLVIAVGTYGWNKYGTDDAQPKKAALSVTETVDSTQDTERKNKSVHLLWQKLPGCICSGTEKSNSQKELAEGTVDDLFFVEDTGSAEAKKSHPVPIPTPICR